MPSLLWGLLRGGMFYVLFLFLFYFILFFFVKYIYKICIGRSLCNYSSSGWEAFFSSASTKPCTSYGDERRCTREGFACFLDCIFLCSKGRGEGDPSSHRMRPPKLFVHLSGKRITYPHIANQPQTSYRSRGDEGVKRVMGLPGDYVLLNSPDSGSEKMMQVSFYFI